MVFSLRDLISDAKAKKVAIGHFNISDLAGLHAIFNAAFKLKVPVIIGVSEGEREFIGVRQAAYLVRSFREEYNYPIFINADHTHSLEKVKEAVNAGFDAVLFDAGQKSLEENIALTKQVVDFVKSFNQSYGKDVLVEGELGYIGSGSVILDRIPEGVSIKKEDLTKPEDAYKFVKETGVDLLAPAVGNIHGMFADVPNPNLDITRIAEISDVTGVPLVLHGASGNTDDDILQAISAGIRIVHVNTQLRVAWRRGLDLALLSHPKEIAPYKLFFEVVHEVEKVVLEKLKLFNNLS
jgi:fructose-bisphosphate aldolase class II